MQFEQKKIFCIILLLMTLSSSFGQKRLSGIVKNATSGERLIGTTVWDLDLKTGTVSDKQGQFSLITKSPANLRFSYIGYNSKILKVSMTSDTLIEVLLMPGAEILDGVEVVAKQARKSFNIATLSVNEIINIPNLTGKPDVLKALQLQPGIRSQSEMSSVTLVRGGNPGENLYLLDNTPLIYVHHIGGYMSVFNTDMISDVEVYKGSFPAKYGERLSSIINISQKEGDKSELNGSLSVGLSDISFSIEGPTKLKNSSFIITGRKTLIDLFYICATGGLDSKSDLFLTYGFHDINGKFSWSPNRKHSLHFNIYQGDDYLAILPKIGRKNQTRVSNIWGNWLAAADWSYISSSNLFIKNTLSYTSYRLKNSTLIRLEDEITGEEIKRNNYKMRSSVQDVSLRSDANYLISNNWNLDFGLKFSYLKFVPSQFESTLKADKNAIDKSDAFESAIYLSNKLQFFKKLDADIGLRLVNYTNNEICNFSLEPRVSISYNFRRHNTLNVSYMRVSQNAQLIYNTGSLTSNEIYIPSGKGIPISFSHQISLGWSMDFKQEMFAIEANVYYKTLDHLTTYKEGYSYSSGDMYWREKLETGGRGIAKGFELIFKKQKGKWTGFVGYSLSKSTRQFDNINGGKSYAFDFDSPHIVSLSVGYQISEKWSVGATWQYQSGIPFTPVIGRHNGIDVNPETGEYLPYEILIYGDKNSGRMRAYHRLDFAFKYQKYTKKRHNKTEWTFGIYNAYNRQNPYFYYYDSPDNVNAGIFSTYNPRTEEFSPMVLYQLSLFSIMPMISYKIWFGTKFKKIP
ncbi:MAG: carboxypeptidase-like regulatory domain-containing protein [Bacteroidales bacterium]